MHHLFYRATPLFPHDVTAVCWLPCFGGVLQFSLYSNFVKNHSFVFFAVRESRRIFLNPFLSQMSRRVSSFFVSVRLSQPYVATGHTSAFISRIFDIL